MNHLSLWRPIKAINPAAREESRLQCRTAVAASGGSKMRARGGGWGLTRCECWENGVLASKYNTVTILNITISNITDITLYKWYNHKTNILIKSMSHIYCYFLRIINWFIYILFMNWSRPHESALALPINNLCETFDFFFPQFQLELGCFNDYKGNI